MSEQNSTIDAFKNMTGVSIGLAILTIILGFIAISRPYPTGLWVSTFIGTIIVIAGIVYLAYAFAADGAGSFIGRTLIGVIYIAGGIYLIANPELALESLTYVVAIILIAEGALQMANYFQFRSFPGAGWIRFSGILTTIMGIVLVYPWFGSSEWGVGALVGFNLLFSGFTRLMYTISARKVAKAAA